jgi:aminotransferase
VGWVIAAPDLTDGIRKVHDFLTVGAAAPLQQAGALALTIDDSYYVKLAADYTERRDFAISFLSAAGFECIIPRGAYYIMTDVTRFGFPDESDIVRHLIEKVGVAGVPGRSFYANKNASEQKIRFCFCKKYETLVMARYKLMQFA